VQWPFHILWKQTRHSQACVNYMEFTNFSFYLHLSKHPPTHIHTHSIITYKHKHNHFYPYHLRHITSRHVTKQKPIGIMTGHRIHSNPTHDPQRITAACTLLYSTLLCPVLSCRVHQPFLITSNHAQTRCAYIHHSRFAFFHVVRFTLRHDFFHVLSQSGRYTIRVL